MPPPQYQDETRRYHGSIAGILVMLIIPLPTTRSMSPPMPKFGPYGRQAYIRHLDIPEFPTSPSSAGDLPSSKMDVTPNCAYLPMTLTMPSSVCPENGPDVTLTTIPDRPVVTPGTKSTSDTWDHPSPQPPVMGLEPANKENSVKTRPNSGPDHLPVTMAASPLPADVTCSGPTTMKKSYVPGPISPQSVTVSKPTMRLLASTRSTYTRAMLLLSMVHLADADVGRTLPLPAKFCPCLNFPVPEFLWENLCEDVTFDEPLHSTHPDPHRSRNILNITPRPSGRSLAT